jgi:hypothetical protein
VQNAQSFEFLNYDGIAFICEFRVLSSEIQRKARICAHSESLRVRALIAHNSNLVKFRAKKAQFVPVFGAFLRNSPLHRRFVPAAVVPVGSCKAAAHRRREVNFPESTKRRPAVARQAFFFRSGGFGSCCGGVSVGSDPRKRLQTGVFGTECLIDETKRPAGIPSSVFFAVVWLRSGAN